jgi:hypothetical protein
MLATPALAAPVAAPVAAPAAAPAVAPAAAPAADVPVPVATAVTNALSVAGRGRLVNGGAGQAFTRRAVLRDAGGATHVRLDRTYRGLKVLGGDVVMHVDRAGTVRSAAAPSPGRCRSRPGPP